MQNRYTGDIGDYVKYGLLRALADAADWAWPGISFPMKIIVMMVVMLIIYMTKVSGAGMTPIFSMFSRGLLSTTGAISPPSSSASR